MHYNDAGGTRANPPNIDTIEQRLASLTKHAGRNNLGMIGEIEGLLKQVKDLIESPSN
jgi:C4-type Zn-finger protein